MAQNLNVNDLCDSNTAEEFRKDSAADIFSEDITVTKTEVKWECYDLDMSIDDIEFGYIKKEYISSPENNFRKENLDVKRTEQSSNANVDITVTKSEVKEEYHDVEMLVDDTEFANIEEDYIFLPENNFKKENFEPMKSTKQSSNEDVVSGNYQLRKEDLQKRQKLSKNRLQLKCKAERINSLKRLILAKQDGESKKHRCADSNFAAHRKRSAKQKKYKCTDCKYATYLKQNFDRHIRTHTNDKPFKCMYKNCKCIPGQAESCKCSMCGYAAAQKINLQVHMLGKHSAEPKKYECANCNYACHKKSQLVQHMSKHTNERPFKCTYKNCKCTAGQEESCKCNMCGYTAVRKVTLKVHILRKHSAEPKKYKCANCNYACHKKSQLVQHMSKHTNERPFKCTYKNCKCTAGQEKPCKCSMCEYAASRKSYLDVHILTKHSGEPKKYKCAQCKFSAHQKQALMLHIGRHADERRFK